MYALDMFADTFANWSIQDLEVVALNISKMQKEIKQRTVTDIGLLEAYKQVEATWPTQLIKRVAYPEPESPSKTT